MTLSALLQYAVTFWTIPLQILPTWDQNDTGFSLGAGVLTPRDPLVMATICWERMALEYAETATALKTDL
jgi:hypothetical protein